MMMIVKMKIVLLLVIIHVLCVLYVLCVLCDKLPPFLFVWPKTHTKEELLSFPFKTEKICKSHPQKAKKTQTKTALGGRLKTTRGSHTHTTAQNHVSFSFEQ